LSDNEFPGDNEFRGNNGFYGDTEFSGDTGEFADDEFEELEPHEEILEEWMDLGWFDLLPSSVLTITTGFNGLTAPRIDFDDLTAEALATGELKLLDEDPLWPVLTPEQAVEGGIEDPDDYPIYLSSQQEQREQWADIVSRSPELGVTTLNGLLELLIKWQLIRDNDGELELLEVVPDPLEILPLTEEQIAQVALTRIEPEIDAVEDVLHEFLYHGDRDELATTLQKLGEQADVSVDVVRLAVVMLITNPESGLTADRFGPLDSEGIEQLKEHQKFTLKVDRSAPGLSGHEH
jgi:hypothetical protein